ncbi:MAG: FtsQ-type POTRA domain-containing protein [Acidobacteria bacterium]|nr:MAG: FtsQ-type POTRA domain-containing protein [Acidobacteriota bacterium]
MFGMDGGEAGGETETSSETPYMRRSRAVAVRQTRIPRGIRRIAWWSGVVLFVLMPMGLGGYLLGAYLLNSPRLQVASPADVVVNGNHYVSREEVLAALGVQAAAPGSGANIFRTSLDQREKQVESIPWVHAATVMRSYPHSLVVYVGERVPVAFVDVGGQVKMVDQQGVLLDPPDRGHFDFPVVKGLDFQGDPADRAARLDLYQEFMHETSGKIASFGWVVSEVDLSDASNLKALLVQNGQTLLVYFGNTSFLDRFDNLMTVLPQLRKTNSSIDSVDLRFRNQVVVNPAGQGSAGSQSNVAGTSGNSKGT